MADDGASSSSSSTTPTPTPTIIILETSQLHPLQQNFREGPKGAYEVKRVKNGVYVRVDMPGVQSESNVHVVKMDNQIVRFQGFAHKRNEWPLDKSARFYVGKMKVESKDFDVVSITDKSFSNGCIRFLINGATDVSLFLDPNTGKPKENEAPPNRHYHLNPSSLLIVGLANMVKHRDNCSCCRGQKVDKTLTGPIHEEMGYINPFVLNGVKGVYEARFEALVDGSGEYFLYFRLDMPDCTPHSCIVNVKDKNCIFILGYKGVDDFRNDEPGGRKYSCDLKLRCSCCTFDTSDDTFMWKCEHGVLRMVVKIRRHTVMIKEENTSVSVRGDSSTSPAPAESSKSGSSKRYSRPNRHRR